MGWVVGRIKVDGDAAGASVQPLRMALDHAVGQGFAQTVQFSRPDGVFKARQGWLRSQIAARDRIAVEQHLVNGVGRQAGRVRSLDVRRFRPNVVVRLLRRVPFQEDEWLGGVLSFGEGDDAPAITVTMRDVRCSMVNLDPDSASPAPEVLKAVVRVHQNTAGIYGAVTRIGRLAVGQTILLRAATEKGERG